jgi:16S rRNA (adenine1518-N6/adenine1519-N6)-dimethyltransferase
LRLDLPIEDILVMVQLEVGQRIVARPGSRQYGYLSVLCQHLAETQIHFRVSPGCFVPRPKVCSVLVSLRPKHEYSSLTPLDSFLETVKAAFAHRRKTLSNSLREHSEIGAVAEDGLVAAGISRSRRAEDLTLEEYEALAVEFTKIREQGK